MASSLALLQLPGRCPGPGPSPPAGDLRKQRGGEPCSSCDSPQRPCRWRVFVERLSGQRRRAPAALVVLLRLHPRNRFRILLHSGADPPERWVEDPLRLPGALYLMDHHSAALFRESRTSQPPPSAETLRCLAAFSIAQHREPRRWGRGCRFCAAMECWAGLATPFRPAGPLEKTAPAAKRWGFLSGLGEVLPKLTTASTLNTDQVDAWGAAHAHIDLPLGRKRTAAGGPHAASGWGGW